MGIDDYLQIGTRGEHAKKYPMTNKNDKDLNQLVKYAQGHSIHTKWKHGFRRCPLSLVNCCLW